MIEMQSGFRGYLLTGQEVFLQPYFEGLHSVPPLLKEQLSLVGSSGQREKLDSISNLHDSWLKYANQLISTRMDTLPESGKRYNELFETQLRMEVGKKLNDRIQLMFSAFDNDEYHLRQERRAALQSTLKYTRNITLTLTLISIVMALLIGSYFIRSITRRISLMVSLAEKISQGEFKTIDDKKDDELNKLSLSLNAMSQQLEKNFEELTKKNNELDQFAYVVSHDLKAPLRGIANIISWIEEDHEKDITPEIRNSLGLIKGRATRLENSINGLLEYARVGKMKKGSELVDTEKLIAEIVDLLVPKGYEVIVENNMPVLNTEKLHIYQVFSNLISNAVKYNRNEKGRIIVKAEELSDAYRFSVIDNGPGIQPQYFEKIFVIFQTLQERDAFESTGVGLAIVKKIVEDYKGTISVESEPGKGSTFTFTWPKNKEDEA
jgi:signal transduction histidine kinase